MNMEHIAIGLSVAAAVLAVVLAMVSRGWLLREGALRHSRWAERYHLDKIIRLERENKALEDEVGQLRKADDAPDGAGNE